MQLQENLSDFMGDFSEVAQWKGNPVDVIFDNSYSSDLGTVGRTPQIKAPEASFVGALQGDALVVKGTNYKIVNIEPDGTGFLVIRLTVA